MQQSLRPFQRRFIAAATRPRIDNAVLTLPRGNGKSWLAGYMVARILNPADPLFRPGTESVLCAASIEQARVVFRFARAMLERAGGYRFQDAATRVGILHVATNTRLRVIGSNGKTALGLVNTPWAVCDEPGAWEVNGGQLLNDALETAKGKPGSPLRTLYIGTLAPASAGWWHDLVDSGSNATTHVFALRGRADRWDDWNEIRRCNPLTQIDAGFRAKLLSERDAARVDTRLKARFLSYRLNIPSADETTVLLTVDDWRRVCGRPVADRDERPIVGVDLGGGRSWSAAVALWPSGRLEALAVAPGVPSLDRQETRDRVSSGTYQRLVAQGSLVVAPGLRVQPAAMLIERIVAAWGRPRAIVCDRFRLADLEDSVRGKCPIFPRVTRWSEASEDIRALRSSALDGPLSCDVSSQSLIAASLSVATVKNDDAGNVRLVKRGTHNTARDDVAAALTLAAGQSARMPKRSPRRLRLVG